ncbi:hypothetical protein Zmor_015098 [Zophobas morio]|uniref:G domain-containing protein n=1 Tax=Zophobas morio TaxID=2755281 RepID=A0AA38IDL2_9CUCU|nr:hypothetical protein Zmor_015098 [Zophobas morio]
MTEINLLLLGEHGVGKTTFVNSLINYIHYENIQGAFKNTPIVAAPQRVSVVDRNNEEGYLSLNTNIDDKFKFKIDTRRNEYIVPVDGHRLRLIDSAGFEISKDGQPELNTLRLPSHLRELHAVCFFLKSSDFEISPSFESLMTQIVTKLDAAAIKNFVFILTGSRKFYFYSTSAYTALWKFVDTIKSRTPEIKIPVSSNNVFCVNNEAFVHLVAHMCGTPLNSKESENSEASWKKSQGECKRLLAYVSKLRPFQLPVNGAVEPIQTFLEKNSPPLLHILLSNFKNSKKCKKLLDDSEQACHLVDDMKQVIQNPPAPSSHHKQHHPQKKQESQTRDSVDGDMKANLEKTAKILKQQKKFIANACKVVETQQDKIYQVLEKFAAMATFLETYGLDDNLEAKIASASSEEGKNEREKKILDKVRQVYERIKRNAKKEAKIEVNEDEIATIGKDLEKLQLCQEVLDNIFKN